MLVLIIGWWHGKRGEKSASGDINWDREKEMLAAIAAQKKAQRLAEKATAQNTPQRKSVDDDYEIPDPLEGWNDEEASSSGERSTRNGKDVGQGQGR